MPLWYIGRGKARSISVAEAEEMRTSRLAEARKKAAETRQKKK